MTELHDYRLRLPGPTEVPERVREAIARPVVSHRGPEFRAILERSEKLLQPILGTRNHVFFFASSGTGMMEAALVNVLGQGERVLVSAHGQFGERFAAIARALGASVDTLDIPWGYAPTAAQVEERIKAVDYRAFVVVHNDSATGVVANLAAIGGVLRERDTLLVVDSVSGLGGVEMHQDEWGVDIVASASQKALMCPPGIGIISMSEKAWKIVERDDRMPRFYWDFRKAREAVEKPETPFTPPVSLMAGLQESLEMIHEEGLPEALARQQRLNQALRAGCEAMGLKSYPKAEMISSTVACFEVPERLNGKDIVRGMKERGTVIAGSRNKLDGRVIRIGTMGCVTDFDIVTDLRLLQATLTDLGLRVDGAGVLDAAARYLREEQNGR